MPADSVKVLSAWPSCFGNRVLIALQEKGIPYAYQEENLGQKSQLLLEYSPVHKKVPVLIHNGKPVCESLIIVQYIDEAWPGANSKCFLPETPYERATARFWADFVDKKFYDAGARIRNTAGEAQEAGKRDFIESFITMDKALKDVAGDKPYFGGDSIGLVDIAFAPFICWFHTYEVLGNFKLPDEEECPHLRAWIKRLSDYPSVKEALPDPEKVLEYATNIRKKLLA